MKSLYKRKNRKWQVLTARMMMWILVFALGLALAPHAGAQERPNIIIQTDIHPTMGEPDDYQSLIRFLLEANEFNILGLIATDRSPEVNQQSLDRIHEVIDAYEKVYPNLIKHASGYPTADYLRSVATVGNSRADGSTVTSRAQLIINQVDAAQGTVWIAAWGGTTTVGSALREVQATRTTAQLNAFVSKIRLFEAWGQCTDGNWIAKNFPNMFQLRDFGNFAVNSVQTNQLGESDYDWQYADDWWYADNIEGKGPMGAIFPKRNYYSASDQGPSLYLLAGRYGLSDPEQPTWGSWGGRFNSRKTKNPSNMHNDGGTPDWYVYTPAHDNHAGYNNHYITTARWRRAVQNDFLARLNWSVASTYEAANHPPVANVDGSLRRTVTSGEGVNLSAAGSTDPDGDSLTYRWWHYPEPGTYKKPLEISSANSRDAIFVAPDVASTQTIHIILEVTDTGTPPLTRYQRVIVTVNPGPTPPDRNPAPVIYDAPWAWFWWPQTTWDGTTATKRIHSLNVVAGYEDRPANPGEFTYTWTQVSGPKTVISGNTNGTANGDIVVADLGPIPSFNPGTRYVFHVTVCNGTQSVTAPLTLVSWGNNPYARLPNPGSLSATAVSSSRINLSWSNTDSRNVGYRVTRRTGTAGDWVHVANVARNETSYSDTGLAEGTTYYYRVQTLAPHRNSSTQGAVTVSATTTVQPVLLIFDTDLQSDSDDAGALAVAHYLTNTGEAELIGVITSTVGPHVVAAAAAINHYYGRPNIPVGLSVDPINHSNDDYAPTLADTTQFPSNKTNATAPNSTTLYRKLLHEAPRKVTIVVVGFQGPISALLDSPANYKGDGIPMTGMQLATNKVEQLVIMGGDFNNTCCDPRRLDFNIRHNLPAAQNIAHNWPGQIVYSGMEIGRPIVTGGGLTNPEVNPVAMAYKLYRGTGGGRGVIGNRHSWDQTAVLYAVRGIVQRQHTNVEY